MPTRFPIPFLIANFTNIPKFIEQYVRNLKTRHPRFGEPEFMRILQHAPVIGKLLALFWSLVLVLLVPVALQLALHLGTAQIGTITIVPVFMFSCIVAIFTRMGLQEILIGTAV